MNQDRPQNSDASRTSRPTRDREQIRLWAAFQKAKPAEVLPGHIDAEPSQLDFLLPGEPTLQPRLRIIDWDHFFAAFEAHGLTFVYEILPDGRPGKRFELLQVEELAPNATHASSGTHDDTAGEYAE